MPLLNEGKAAIFEMESIPSKTRNLPMHLMMGKLYRNTCHFRAAAACYKERLRFCLYILEAITHLAELGVSAKKIISLFSQTLSKSGRPVSDALESGRWLQRYVEAQCCIASNDYKGGLEVYTELLQRFPNNVHIFLEIAKVEAIFGKNDEAIVNFEKGNLLLSLNRPEAAVSAFRYAQELKPDFVLIELSSIVFGALQSQGSCKRGNEDNASIGKSFVHAKSSNGREKAKKFCESSLRLEPSCLGAALALAELHVVEG